MADRTEMPDVNPSAAKSAQSPAMAETDWFNVLQQTAAAAETLVREYLLPALQGIGESPLWRAILSGDLWSQLKEFPSELQEALIGEGHVPHMYELSLKDLAEVVRAHKEGGSSAAVQLLHELHLELFTKGSPARTQIECRWQRSKRWPILSQVLQAHDAGLYGVSIPAAIAQVEGVIADRFHRGGRLQNKKLKEEYIPELWPTAEDLKQLVDLEPVVARLVDAFVTRVFLADFDWGDPIPRLSRHAILHGADIDYGTLQNSIQALVWLDVLLARIEELPMTFSPVCEAGPSVSPVPGPPRPSKKHQQKPHQRP